LLANHGESELALSDCLAFLQQRKAFLDGVVLSGGEPTLQPDLAEFVLAVRRLGYSIKLDTNGSRPAILRQLLERKLLDFIAMDVKAPMAKYHRLAGLPVDIASIEESISIIQASGIPHQFRTTWVPQLLSKEELDTISNSLRGLSSHVVQSFRPELARAGDLS
jgi:pyruvate formate lyase activating enzyme